MRKSTKLLLGLATLWPFFYVILFFTVVFSTILFMPGSAEPGPPPLISLILPLHLFTMLESMALMVFYIVNLFRNDRVEKDKKALWAVVLFMGNMIAMPIYWYLYIWTEARPALDFPQPSMLGGADPSGLANNTKGPTREQEYMPPSQPPNWRQ